MLWCFCVAPPRSPWRPSWHGLSETCSCSSAVAVKKDKTDWKSLCDSRCWWFDGAGAYLRLTRPCCSCSSTGHESERACLSDWRGLAAHLWRSWCDPPLCPDQPQSQKALVWTPVSEIYAPQWCLRGDTHSDIKPQIRFVEQWIFGLILCVCTIRPAVRRR